MNYLGEPLKINKSIGELNLDKTEIGENEKKNQKNKLYISKALKFKKSILILYLESYNHGRNEKIILIEAIEVKNSIEELYL